MFNPRSLFLFLKRITGDLVSLPTDIESHKQDGPSFPGGAAGLQVVWHHQVRVGTAAHLGSHLKKQWSGPGLICYGLTKGMSQLMPFLGMFLLVSCSVVSDSLQPHRL